MRRFYDQVGIAEFEAGFGVDLGGRPLNSPAKKPLVLPTRRLAEAIAAEWRRQGERIRPADMPLTQLANTAIDQVPAKRTEIVEELAAYAQTDMLCYRASSPARLVALQAAHWQPLLDWVEAAYGARFRLTDAVVPLEQDVASVAAIRDAVAAQSDFALAALHLATNASGSVLIGLAVVAGRVDVAAAHRAAFVDDCFQIETWGDDEEAVARLERLKADIEDASIFASLAAAD